MEATDRLSASMEDYLQVIYHLQSEKYAARGRDIAARLKVNSSSVTGALRALSKKGYINYAPYDVITLTDLGMTYARDVVRRHEALKKFFTTVLNAEEAEAEATACKMEHVISRSILDRMIRFVNIIQVCPRGGREWIQELWGHSDKHAPYEGCETCISRCQEAFRETQRAIEEMPPGGVNLTELGQGQKGKVLRLEGSAEVRRRLAEKGVAVGYILEVEGRDREENAMDVVIRGYHIRLREADARHICVGQYL